MKEQLKKCTKDQKLITNLQRLVSDCSKTMFNENLVLHTNPSMPDIQVANVTENVLKSNRNTINISTI